MILVAKPSNVVVYLSAETIDERTNWVEALRTAIPKARKKLKVRYKSERPRLRQKTWSFLSLRRSPLNAWLASVPTLYLARNAHFSASTRPSPTPRTLLLTAFASPCPPLAPTVLKLGAHCLGMLKTLLELGLTALTAFGLPARAYPHCCLPFLWHPHGTHNAHAHT